MNLRAGGSPPPMLCRARDPCEGCHATKAATIATAGPPYGPPRRPYGECKIRTEMCEDIIAAAEALVRPLRYAQARLRTVPADLVEPHESVYSLIRRGG
jgi:hypothetical protein